MRPNFATYFWLFVISLHNSPTKKRRVLEITIENSLLIWYAICVCPFLCCWKHTAVNGTCITVDHLLGSKSEKWWYFALWIFSVNIHCKSFRVKNIRTKSKQSRKLKSRYRARNRFQEPSQELRTPSYSIGWRAGTTTLLGGFLAPIAGLKGAQVWDIRSLGFSWFLHHKVFMGR